MGMYSGVETVMVAEPPASTASVASKRARTSNELEIMLPPHLRNTITAYAEHNPIAGNFLLVRPDYKSDMQADELNRDTITIVARNNGAGVTPATAFVVTDRDFFTENC